MLKREHHNLHLHHGRTLRPTHKGCTRNGDLLVSVHLLPPRPWAATDCWKMERTAQRARLLSGELLRHLQPVRTEGPLPHQPRPEALRLPRLGLCGLPLKTLRGLNPSDPNWHHRNFISHRDLDRLARHLLSHRRFVAQSKLPACFFIWLTDNGSF